MMSRVKTATVPVVRMSRWRKVKGQRPSTTQIGAPIGGRRQIQAARPRKNAGSSGGSGR